MTGERILVVDDGADMRDFVINYVIKPNGFDYLEARDGLEGFEMLAQYQPDMVLLDLQMPRLDGIGLLKKMRAENINIPAVLMTFYGSEEIAIEVFRLGVKDYVIKPFTDDELLEAIEKALTETRLRRERDSLQDRLLGINRELHQQVEDLQVLVRVGKGMAALPDEANLCRQITEAASIFAQTDRVMLLLASPEAGQFINRVEKTPNGIAMGGGQHKHHFAAQAVKAGRTLIGDPEYDSFSGVFRVQVAVPIMLGRDALGVIVALTEAERISDHHVMLLGALADYAALGLKQPSGLVRPFRMA